MPLELPILPIWFEVCWMTLNCGFGAALARHRGAPVFGTLLSGLFVGLGGGIARDILLGLEPVAISVWYYLPAGLVGALGGALVYRTIMSWPTWLLVLQGVTLGFLVTIGTQKAISYQAPWFSAMALGVVTASFGGMIADVVNGRRAGVVKQSHWTAVALCIGAAIFWLLYEVLLRTTGVSLELGLWVAALPAVAAITALHAVSVRRNWPSLSWPEEPRPA